MTATTEAIKEHPIPFTAPMVRAILDGTKTQTRRVVKPQPEYKENESVPGHFGTWFHGWNLDHEACGVEDYIKHCPYGQPGDRLWVREPQRVVDVGMLRQLGGGPSRKALTVEYLADKSRSLAIAVPERLKEKPVVGRGLSGGGFRESSRLVALEVVSVRVERVQNITLADVAAEGAPPTHDEGWDNTETFRELWDSINAKRGYDWSSNPWVWVVEFKKIDA